MKKRHSGDPVGPLLNRLEVIPEGLWYATLSPEGQIQQLKSIDKPHCPDLFVQKLYFRSAIEQAEGPLIVVRKGKQTHMFDEWDWFFIEMISIKGYFPEKIFDYIKVFKHHCTHLSDHEVL